MLTSSSMERRTMKASKPAMEKRRRARINESLLQLKALVLDGINKNNSRHSKLEKADILEMTVRYLRSVQREQVHACVNLDARTVNQYRSGFTECMGEVSRCGIMDASPDVRARLIGHLAGMCTSSSQPAEQPPPGYGGAAARGQTRPTPPTPPPGSLRVLPAAARPSPAVPPPPPPAMIASTVRVAATDSASGASTSPVSPGRPRPPAQTAFPPVTPPLSSSSAVTSSPPHLGGGAGKAFAGPAPFDLQAAMPPSNNSVNARDSSAAAPRTDAPASSRVKRPALPARSLPLAAPKRTPPPPPPPLPPPPPPPAADNSMITLILPSQSLPGGHVPTHLIPVYAHDAGKGEPPTDGIRVRRGDAPATAAAGNVAAPPVRLGVPNPGPEQAGLAVPGAVSPGRPGTWTAVRVPAGKLVSPQAGAMAPRFAFALPYGSPRLLPAGAPGPGVQAKLQPAGFARGPRVQMPPSLPNPDATADGDDPMWRPW